MRFCRKNVDNEWVTIKVSKEEVEKVRLQTIKEFKKVYALLSATEEFKKLSEPERAVVLDKMTPSFFSILDDFISIKLKKKEDD